jgi:hypothetical protein
LAIALVVSLMAVLGGQNYVGIFSVTLKYKYLRKTFVHLVGLL